MEWTIPRNLVEPFSSIPCRSFSIEIVKVGSADIPTTCLFRLAICGAESLGSACRRLAHLDADFRSGYLVYTWECTIHAKPRSWLVHSNSLLFVHTISTVNKSVYLDDNLKPPYHPHQECMIGGKSRQEVYTLGGEPTTSVYASWLQS